MSKTASDFRPTRRNATIAAGESPEETRAPLGLDGDDNNNREAAWRAAEGLGCQAAVAGGMLGIPGGAARCVGHLVAGGDVLRADNDSAGELKAKGRGEGGTRGHITEMECLIQSHKFHRQGQPYLPQFAALY